MSDDNLKTWPERIWLQHSEDGMPVPEFNVGTDEITWCQDRQFDCDVEYVRADRITELERQNAELVKALYDADHLADCAMSLLLAMNRLIGAEDRLEIDDLDDIARAMAEKEFTQASAQVSEFWTGTRDAAHEYRSRAEKARDAAPHQQSDEKEGAGTVDIDREGARFWHRNCTNHLGGVMKVAKDEPDKSLITCLHCGKSGYYPVGGVGRICVPEVIDAHAKGTE